MNKEAQKYMDEITRRIMVKVEEGRKEESDYWREILSDCPPSYEAPRPEAEYWAMMFSCE
jgi:hypothetical protein